MNAWTLLRWLAMLAVALVGAVAGFDFGLRLGGALLGTLLALNAAAMVALVADGLMDRASALVRALRRRVAA